MSNTNSSINQSVFTVATYTIQQLMDMPSTLNGEQSPLDVKRSDKLIDSLLDGPLLQPLEVTVFNGMPILTGGRHRTACLSQLYSDDLDKLVTVLQYVALTADDVLSRVKSSNGSRAMKQGEVKLLDVAAKLGFGLVTVESLIASIDTVRVLVPGTTNINVADTKAEQIELFITALSLSLDETYDMGDTTALVVARSILTPLKKVKATLRHPAIFDEDAQVQLCNASVEKYLFVPEVLTMGTDAVTELLETIVNSIGDMASRLYPLSAKVYTDALHLNMDMVTDVEPTITDGVVTFVTTIRRPTALQRNSAKFVKVAIKPMIQYIAEALEVELG